MAGRVLVTRSPDRAKPLIHELSNHEIEAFAVPVTKTVIDIEGKELPDLTSFRWLAFTSFNGVDAFTKALEINKQKLPDGLKIAAVGATTAQIIRGKLKTPDLVPSKANGKELAQAIIDNDYEASNSSVLWPCAQNALDNFAKELNESGIEVECWKCYKTLEIDINILKPQLMAHAPWDIALFAAPSAVKAFNSAWDNEFEFTACALGSTTANALRENGFSDVAVSKGAGVNECVESIINVFNERKLKIS